MATKYQIVGMLVSMLLLMIVSLDSKAATAPTISMTASPSIVTYGEESRITWSSTYASLCSASGAWTGSEPLSGSKYTSDLTTSETYVLTCTGSGGKVIKSITVAVAPTVAISASPKSVASGSKSTISWSTRNATACTGTGAWSGSEALSGSKLTGALTADVTYALTCTGPGGRASQSTTVSIYRVGDAIVSWTAPTKNTNGTPVGALTGYHLYYGSSSTALTKSIGVGSTTTSFEITGLTAGTWYFAVAADSSDGTESAKSIIGSKAI